MLLLHRRRQHDDLACATRCQRESLSCSAHLCETAKHPAKPPDFDSQSRAVRVIDVLRAECPRYEHVARHICRPRFGKRTRECEQHGARCERHGST